MAAQIGTPYNGPMGPDQTGCHEGPTILFDRPVREPPPLTSFVSQLGRPFCGCRVQSMRNAWCEAGWMYEYSGEQDLALHAG